MWCNGKEMDLEEYVAYREKDYEGKPGWMWEHEGLVWAIQDYYSSMGEFSFEDRCFLFLMDFTEEDFICNE